VLGEVLLGGILVDGTLELLACQRKAGKSLSRAVLVLSRTRSIRLCSKPVAAMVLRCS
jgi:hypothetical protein